MDKHKMLDLFQASNEEAGEVVISEILPAVVKEYGGCIVAYSALVISEAIALPYVLLHLKGHKYLCKNIPLVPIGIEVSSLTAVPSLSATEGLRCRIIRIRLSLREL